MKFGLFVLVILAAVLWWGHLKKQHRAKRREAETVAPPESIVACLVCGLHVPASDAIVSTSGASFCCEAHRQLHPDA